MTNPVWTCALCEATLRGKLVQRSQTEPDICTWCEDELRRRGKRYCRTGHHSSDDFPSPAYRTCRACINARRRARYQENPDEQRAARRDYYAAHPEQERARSTRYRDHHIERVRARERHRYHTKPEVREQKLSGARAWRKQNREHCNRYYRTYKLQRKVLVLRQMRGGQA